MVGQTVSEVIDSSDPSLQPGDIVETQDGWQEYGLSDASSLRRIDASLAPVSTALGVLGMPGLTAYVGLNRIAQIKNGETVLVSAASGAVGSVVGQIAKLQGCRAVGIAGSDEKCRYVTEELGFDACVNRRSEAYLAALEAACPTGVDVYFDNVGGILLAAAVKLLNMNGRIALCGTIGDSADAGYSVAGN